MRIVPTFVAVSLLLACGSPAASSDPDDRAWIEACVRVSGCDPYASTPDPAGACLVSRLEFYGALPAECALAAGECGAAVACFGAGSAPIACPGGRTTRCEGEVVRGCDASLQLEVARDCAAEGLSCRTNDFGDAHCAMADTCERSTCDGDVLVQCFGALPLPHDCGTGVCVETEDGAACAGEGETCEGFVFRCDDDVATSCVSGRIHREQCAPGACRTDDGARCVSTDECTPRCEDGAVIRCIDGVVERFACDQWGFTECFTGGGTPSCR